MLINLRNAMMAGRRLPYDAELEYLESTGTQWIDTGIVATNNTRVKVAFSDYTQVGAWLFGARRGYKNAALGVFTETGSTNNKWIRAFGNFISSNFTFSTVDLGVSTFDYNCGHFTGTREKVPITVDYTDTAPAFDSSPYTIYLWTVNLAGTAGTISSAKIYASQIWQNGVLVRDYIPVRKGTVGYLYDRVSGKLFGNAGTGDFVLGPDVVPVEWLEGGQLDSGIAFINTGYTPNSSTKVESTAAILSANGYSGRFGNQSRLAFGIGNGRLYLAQGGHYFLGSYTVGAFYSFVNDIPNRTVSVEGVGSTSTTAVSDWYPQLYPIYLFASNVAPTPGTNVNGKMLDTNSLGQIRMKSCSIWENDIPVRNFLPVRVGTDATSWEGAMMDVLTRRIYRNDGTGAFGYGNDLKYPIPAE